MTEYDVTNQFSSEEILIDLGFYLGGEGNLFETAADLLSRTSTTF